MPYKFVRIMALVLLFAILLLAARNASAEDGPTCDSGNFAYVEDNFDCDDLNDDVDQCYDQPGPASNNGCPIPPDRDTDGIADDQDVCPDDPFHDPVGNPCNHDEDGDGFDDATDGCPFEPDSAAGCPPTAVPTVVSPSNPLPPPTSAPENASSADSPPQPVIPPTAVPEPTIVQIPVTSGFDLTSTCVVYSRTSQNVNIREWASTESPTVGRLLAGEVRVALSRSENGEGLWYELSEGWVAGWVLQAEGICNNLITAQTVTGGQLLLEWIDNQWQLLSTDSRAWLPAIRFLISFVT